MFLACIGVVPLDGVLSLAEKAGDVCHNATDVAFGRVDSSELVTVTNDGTELATSISLVEASPEIRTRSVALDVDPISDGSAPDGDLDAVVGDIVFEPAVLVNDGTGRLTNQLWAEHEEFHDSIAKHEHPSIERAASMAHGHDPSMLRNFLDWWENRG